MTQAQPIQIRFSEMILWVLPITLAVGALGAYLTWLCSGPSGLQAQMLALVLAWAIPAAGAVGVVRSGPHGAAKVALAYYTISIAKMMAFAGLAVAAWLLIDLPRKPMLLWLLVFALCTLLGESIWLIRSLRRNGVRSGSGAAGQSAPAPRDTEIAKG
jgi:hypothetical protein